MNPLDGAIAARELGFGVWHSWAVAILNWLISLKGL
jgi:hypothetical protein